MSDNSLTGDQLPPLRGANAFSEDDYVTATSRGLALLAAARSRPGFAERQAKVDAYVAARRKGDMHE